MKTKMQIIAIPFIAVTTLFSFTVYGNQTCEAVLADTVSQQKELKTPEKLFSEIKGKRISETKKKLLPVNESSFFELTKMIDSARNGDELHLGMFIFENDFTSSDIAQRLINAGKRGAKINITVDYVMGFKFKKWYQFLSTQSENISTALFNPPQKEGLALLKERFNVQDPKAFFDGVAFQDKNQIFKSIHGSKIEMLLGMIQKFKSEKSNEQDEVLNPTVLVEQLTEAQKFLAQVGIEAKDFQNLIKTLTEYTMRLHHKVVLLKKANGKVKYIVAGRNISDEYLLSLGLFKQKNGKMVPASEKNPLLANRSYPFIDTSVVVETLKSSPDAAAIVDYFNRIRNTSDVEILIAKNENNGLTETDISQFLTDMQAKATELNSQFAQMKKNSRHPLARIRLHIEGQSDIYLENAPREGRTEIHEAWRMILSEGSFKEAHIFSAYFYPTVEDQLSMDTFLKNNPHATLTLYTNAPQTTDMNIVNFTFYVNQKDWFTDMKEKYSDRFQVLELIRERGEGSLHMKQIVLVGQDGQMSMVSNGSAHEDTRSVSLDANAASISLVQNSTAQRILKAYGPLGPLAINWFVVSSDYIDKMIQYAKEKFGSKLDIVHEAGPVDDQM